MLWVVALVVCISSGVGDMLGLRNPRMFYLSQSLKPKSMQAAAVLHDHLSHSTFSNLLQISALTDEKWKQATLPIRYGGFGLTSLQEISNLVFVSSWAHSVHELPKRSQL